MADCFSPRTHLCPYMRRVDRSNGGQKTRRRATNPVDRKSRCFASHYPPRNQQQYVSSHPPGMPDSIHSPAGSKPPSPTEQLKSQIDFQFLNFSHPSDAKTGKTRKAVRSHVTKQQHQRENAAAAAAARRAKSYQATPSDREDAPPQRAHAATFPSARPSSIEPPAPILSTTESSEASSRSPSPAASPTDAPRRRIDPSDIYPEEWRPYLHRIMVSPDVGSQHRRSAHLTS